MSESTLPKTKTRDVLVEVCPNCNALHIHGLVNNTFDGLGKSEMPCGNQIGWEPPKDKDSKELTPIFCDHVIAPRTDNTYTVRHFSLRERQEYNTLLTTLQKESEKMANLNPKLMDYALIHGVVSGPIPLKTKENIDNAQVDGMILEAVYYAVLEYNAPPLAPSSGLRQLSTQTPLRSATTTR